MQPFKKYIMKRTEIYKLLLCAFLVSAYSCTNLEIEQTDSNFENLTGEFTGVDPAASLDGLYNDWRGQIENQGDLYALQEVSSDEQLVPTRGTDWGDNGVWRNLHDHNWDANHSMVKATWNNLNQNVFRATAIIDARSGGTAAQVAEAKFLRALATYHLVDMYGQAPFRTPDEGQEVNPSVKNRTEAFEFAVADLNEALPALPAVGPGGGLNKATKASAQFLLARLHLNKHIYLATGSPASADMNKVVEMVDALSAAGFALESGYFNIFKEDSDNETIFFVGASTGNRIWNTLHYKQGAPGNEGGGWNGFTTLAEFYDLFEGNATTNVPGSGQEERRGFVPTNGDNGGIGYGFLIGQQYDETGAPRTDRPGNPMIFTKELPGLLGNNENTGIRTIKYHPENGSFTGHNVVFRYADAHLMKAEAIMNGASGGNALALVNELRALRGASPMAAVTEQSMLDERGRELYIEGWRRSDQIRLGTWSQPWAYKSNAETFRTVFPIPATALISNPNLTQNEGY
ncbi:MAG: hypothetical protein ACI9HJ_000766 [Ulvibacter sp.]|jgi:hypothetical protein